MSRGKAAAPGIEMSDRIYNLLVEERRKRTIKRHHLDRIDILIRASHQGGGHSNGKIAARLKSSLFHYTLFCQTPTKNNTTR